MVFLPRIKNRFPNRLVVFIYNSIINGIWITNGYNFNCLSTTKQRTLCLFPRSILNDTRVNKSFCILPMVCSPDRKIHIILHQHGSKSFPQTIFSVKLLTSLFCACACFALLYLSKTNFHIYVVSSCKVLANEQ